VEFRLFGCFVLLLVYQNLFSGWNRGGRKEIGNYPKQHFFNKKKFTNNMSQGKFWCFTENSNAEEFRNNLKLVDGVSYICGQLEIASTGQLHFQGYVQLTRSQRMSYCKNKISKTAHWELQKGSCNQARNYCHKEDQTTVADTFVEFGVFVAAGAGAGARNDIHSFVEAIKGGATQRELIESEVHVETFAKYIKFHDRVRSLYPTKRKLEDDFKVSLYFGEPGSGKTRKAYDENVDLFEIPISNGTLWLDGYDGHNTVLFDDFCGAMSKMSLDNTLKFFDRYVRKVPIKGAHVWYQPTHIIVTSNFHPRSWYSWENREEHWGALKRRFHEVIVFHKDAEPEVQDSVEDFFEDHDLWPQEKSTEVTGRVGFERYE
jgi:hypothetical protein